MFTRMKNRWRNRRRHDDYPVRLVRDQYDEAVYTEAFVLAPAVDRFLRRKSTQRAMEYGLLDPDVYNDLVECAAQMRNKRVERVWRARNPEAPGMGWPSRFRLLGSGEASA